MPDERYVVKGIGRSDIRGFFPNKNRYDRDELYFWYNLKRFGASKKSTHRVFENDRYIYI